MDSPDILNQRLFKFLKSHNHEISHQQLKRLRQLSHLLDSGKDFSKVQKVVASIYRRLILELVLIHQNTKQREQELIRLIDKLGCSIDNNELTNLVMNLLINLHKVADQCLDASFERAVLVKYVLKELGDCVYSKRQVEKVLQTLYKCSCFDIISCDNAPARLRLKSKFQSFAKLRHHYDVELIRIAQTNKILLTPESWTYLLYRECSRQNQAYIQSLLDQQKLLVTVEDLREAILKSGDKFGLSQYIPDLSRIGDLTDGISQQETEEENSRESLSRLLDLSHLLTMRMKRDKFRQFGPCQGS